MSERHPYSLLGIDGNAFSIMAYTINAMKQCGYSKDAIECYRSEVMSGDYDNLLSVSLMMVDNCNFLSGYPDDYQQLMKGHDGLDYVDYPHTGTQNRTEKLINENFMDAFMFGFEEKPEEDEEEENPDDEYYQGDDYYRLYGSIQNLLVFILNNYISDNNQFSKADVKTALMDIVNSNDFWDDLEYNVPKKREMNESEQNVFKYLKGDIQRMMAIEFTNLIEEGIKFSRYDVKHAFLQIFNSSRFWSQLHKYIPE